MSKCSQELLVVIDSPIVFCVSLHRRDVELISLTFLEIMACSEVAMHVELTHSISLFKAYTVELIYMKKVIELFVRLYSVFDCCITNSTLTTLCAGCWQPS